jgi:XTP/dITP diphosphohydrolase
VDALNGEPGVYSARYGAPEITTAEGRYRKLLAAIEGLPRESRTARFTCVIAIAPPAGEIQTAEGIWEGHIADQPRGENGFGYDPVFITSDGRTAAELPSEKKNRISHRGLALVAAQPILEKLIAGN